MEIVTWLSSTVILCLCGANALVHAIAGETRAHVAADMKVAWFKDPDGNILNIASR